MRKVGFFAAILLVIIIATAIIRAVVMGNVPVVKLGKAQPLAGIVAQNLDLTGGQISLPVAGKDFSLTNVHYFDNNTWVVANVKPLANSAFQGTVVLQKKNGLYELALGPGTAFDSSYLLSLPGGVGQYLSEQGVIDEFTYQ